jgi:hypothetical protein
MAAQIIRAGQKEDRMNRLSIIAGIAVVMVASPVVAHHVEHLNDAFASRGACEVEKNALSNTDDFLIDAFPDVFSSEGEVRSFLNRAFPCELNAADGQWYMVDHRADVLDSRWFDQRNR